MSSSQTENALMGCVASLQGCSRLLDSSISILHDGVRDFPRTKQVLRTERHFELTSEPALRKAQNAITEEIVPEVDHLLRRVEQQLAKMERREKGLIAKVELQEGRINQTAPKFSDKPTRSGVSEISPTEQLKMLKNKRERLEHTIERLSLQTTHKERQLRMSMNYGV
ncbi:DASH complex subunit Spc19 [Geopyxis carbonaria]|nr:DASH complex subunit Spc19 [Geopyxis carbonaria]